MDNDKLCEYYDKLCEYCEYGDVEQSIHFLCEGRWCDQAEERMEEELKENKNNNKDIPHQLK